MMVTKDPEQYWLSPTINVPNSPLPALVYRNVLPAPLESQSATDLCDGNGWEKRVRELINAGVREGAHSLG